MSLLMVKKVKTRVPHQCWGCTEDIKAGSNVKFSTQAHEGQIFSSYFCNQCEKILEEYYSDFEEGVKYGEVKELYPELFE